ncbi:MAG: type I-E CRISPR-associated protein Cse1/CasA, partial [Blastocatellia bacterium]
MFSFNLIDEPWIPCLMTADGAGQIAPHSLSNALAQAKNIQSIIGDNPLATIAIHRLLLAVLHRVFEGPRDVNDWKALWKREEFDQSQIHAYLSEHKHRFDIFDERFPFYQTAEVSVDKAVSSARLLFQDDENATLFDHALSSQPPEISPALAARMLLVFQAFDVSGLITGENRADTANASPLCQSAVCLVRGNNLFQTLMLNLHHYNSEDEEPFAFDPKDDFPAWEKQEP